MTSKRFGCVAVAAVVGSAACPVVAQSGSGNVPATNPATAIADTRQVASPPAALTGEWGGLRTQLRDDGVDLTASYGSETAANVSGGDRHLVRETGQFVFGATIDADRLFGINGGTLQATITDRRGDDLGAAANLRVLQQVQEVYGRGQTWRLTQFWYQQSFAAGHADLKFGRLTQGEDFGAFSCTFMNLSFCGSPPRQSGGRLLVQLADQPVGRAPAGEERPVLRHGGRLRGQSAQSRQQVHPRILPRRQGRARPG